MTTEPVGKRLWWLDGPEKVGCLILAEEDKWPWIIGRNARRLVRHCKAARRYREQGDIDNAMCEVWRAYGAWHLINSHDYNAIARLELDNYMFDRDGRPLKCGERERAFLRFFTGGRKEAELAAVVRAVWGESWGDAEPDVRQKHRTKLDTMVSRLNARFAGTLVFSVRGNVVTRTDAPPPAWRTEQQRTD